METGRDRQIVEQIEVKIEEEVRIEKGCEPPNQRTSTDEQPKESTDIVKQRNNESDPESILSYEKREMWKAYSRQYRASATDEQRKKQRLCCKRYYDKQTEEQKEMKRARQRHRRATATVDEREERLARTRELRAERTDEQKEKLKDYYHHYWATVPDEKREEKKVLARKRYALQKEKRAALGQPHWPMITEEERELRRARVRASRAKWTEEQKEYLKVYRREHRRKYNYTLSDEQKERKKAYQKEYNQRRKAEQVESKNALLEQCPVKLTVVEIEYCSNLTNESETTAVVNMEGSTSQSGELDYFNGQEDWNARIKMEYNVE